MLLLGASNIKVSTLARHEKKIKNKDKKIKKKLLGVSNIKVSTLARHEADPSKTSRFDSRPEEI